MKSKEELGIKQRRNTGALRYLFAVHESVSKSHGLSIFQERFSQIQIPRAVDLCVEAEISSKQYWRISQKLVSKSIFQAYGTGSGTRYEIRRPAAFFKHFEEYYLKMAGENYFIPYLLPRKLMTLEDKEEKIEELNSKILAAGLPEKIAFFLHTGLGIRGVRHHVFNPREIEIFAIPEEREDIEAALSLNPIMSPVNVRRGKPFLQNADVVLVFNELSQFVMKRWSSNVHEKNVVRDIINLFELRRYSKRGVEAAESFFDELLKDSHQQIQQASL